MTKTMKLKGRKDAGAPPAAAPSNAGTQPAAASAQDKFLTESDVESLVERALGKALQKHAPTAQAPAPAPAAPSAAPANPPPSEKAMTMAEVEGVVEKALARLAQKQADEKAAEGQAGTKQTRDVTDIKRSFETAPHIRRGHGLAFKNAPLHRKELCNLLMKRDRWDGITDEELSAGFDAGEKMLNMRTEGGILGMKALTSTGTNAGDEWVPTDLSSELQRRLYLASNLTSFMAAREINMPSNPFTIPLGTTRPTFYIAPTENTAGTESTPGTANGTLTAVVFKAVVTFSYELDEDSIIAVLPQLQQQLGEAAADVVEDGLLNGDTTATHMDYDTNLVTNAGAKAWKGFRKLALAGSLTLDASTGGVSTDNISALGLVMGKYNVNTEQCALVVGPRGIQHLRNDDDFKTMDKAGDRATLFNGAKVPTCWGMPVIVSARCREDLNASGVDDNVTATKGSYLVFHRDSFWLGRRREFMIETDRDITAQKNIVVASFRKAFSPQETPSSTISSVALAYNYTA